MKKYQISNIKYQISNYKKSNSQPNSGQVVLILVLLTVVGLTIGLSLIARTITDVRISSQIEESSRAFSAAEAGVESALKTGVVGGPTGTVSLPGSEASFSVSSTGNTTTAYIFPVTAAGKTQTVWLVEHTQNGELDLAGYSYPVGSDLDICWGTDPENTPALVVTLLYQEGTDYKIAKGAYAPASLGINYSLAEFGGANYCESNFRYKVTLNATADFGISSAKLIALRLQPVYADTAIGVKPYATLPTQGKQIVSVGQTETGVVRKIQVTQGYYTLPEIFDFSFFTE